MRFCKALQAKHWNVVASEASQSDLSIDGSFGGILSGVDKSLQLSPLSNSWFENYAWKHEFNTAFGLSYQLSFSHIGPVLIDWGYHKGGLDVSLLHRLTHLTQQGQIPFISFCDWNTVPVDAKSSGWEQFLNATFVAPVNPTCKQSEPGSVIDYVLVSNALLPFLVSITTDRGNCWAPHCLVLLTLSKSPSVSKLWVPVIPKALPPSPMPSLPESLANQHWDSWEPLAVNQAKTAMEQGKLSVTKHIAKEIAEIDFEISSDLLLWARQSELFSLSSSQVPEEQWDKFLGRCQTPKLELIDFASTRSKGHKIGQHGTFDVPNHERPAARAAALLVKNVSKVLAKPTSNFWLQNLKETVGIHSTLR